VKEINDSYTVYDLECIHKHRKVIKIYNVNSKKDRVIITSFVWHDPTNALKSMQQREICP
jgi:hypothetical protein